MNEYFFVYLITVLMDVNAVARFGLVIVALVYALVIVVALLFCGEGHTEQGAKILGNCRNKALAWAATVTLTLFLFLPSKEDMYLIAGGGLALKAAGNEEVQKTPSKAIKALNMWLDNQIEDVEVEEK